jgi:hypothetical protein
VRTPQRAASCASGRGSAGPCRDDASGCANASMRRPWTDVTTRTWEGCHEHRVRKRRRPAGERPRPHRVPPGAAVGLRRARPVHDRRRVESNYLVTYFVEDFKYSDLLANNVILFYSVFVAIGSWGRIGDRFGWRKTLTFAGGLGCAVTTLLVYFVPLARPAASCWRSSAFSTASPCPGKCHCRRWSRPSCPTTSTATPSPSTRWPPGARRSWGRWSTWRRRRCSARSA